MWTSREIIQLKAKFRNKKESAKRENVPFAITYAYFKSLCEPRCNFYKPEEKLTVGEMSLHKIVPHLGYIPGNCVITDIAYNRKMGGLTPDEHIDVGIKNMKHIQKKA